MRILYLSTYAPVPMTNGQTIRTMSLVRTLVESAHAVTFVSFVSPAQEAEAIQTLSSLAVNVKLVPRELTALAARTGFLRRLAALICFRPYAIERFRNERMRARVSEQLQSCGFDAIVADSIYALVNLPHTEIPIILNCHNVEWMILNRYAHLERSLLRRAYAHVEGGRMRAVEQASCERSTVCMACSRQDAEVLQTMAPTKKVYVVPNCIDTEAYVPRKAEPESQRRPIVLFQGGMDWFPNRDAVEYFVSRIFPAVRHQFPDTRFIVAGRNPTADFVQKMSLGGNVEFTGTVPDIRPYLAKATIAVVPLRIGSGTRLKILEAAAAGLAIVSTTIGAEGLQFTPGQEIVVADNPDEFANAILALVRNTEHRIMIGRAARLRVVEQYSYARLRAQLGKCISPITELAATRN